MTASKLCEFDADLYRRYAVGLLTYDEALGQARSVFHLRRAMLEFDQNTRTPTPIPPGLSAGRVAQPDRPHAEGV